MPDDAQPRVTTVVMSRNRRDNLLGTLPRHRRPVILVDNGSSDDSVAAVRREQPDVQVIALEQNRGAAARNVGLRQARTPYVAFADDDSWWEPDSLDRAADLLDAHPSLAVVAARILVGPEETVDPVCEQMAFSALPHRDDTPGRPVLGFIACGVVARRDAMLAVGGFDSVVFFPGEEERVALDLAAAGWHLAYVPDVVAHHHPAVDRGHPWSRHRLIVRNTVLTAAMRRPWRVLVRRVAAGVTSGPAGVWGVVSAVPRMPAALARRRRVPAHIEAALALLG